jgi:hypothetical protein
MFFNFVAENSPNAPNINCVLSIACFHMYLFAYLCICCSFNDVVSGSDCVASDNMMINDNEFTGMWNEGIVA